MNFKNGFFKARATKLPRPWGHPIFTLASPTLQFIWQSSHIKHVYRAGLIKRRVPPDKCETTADHTGAGFLTLAAFIGTGYDLEVRLLAIERWSVHDLVESGPFGDIPPGEMEQSHKSWMEHAWFRIVGERVPGWTRLKALFMGYDAGEGPAGLIGKENDKQEAISYSVPLSWRFRKVVPQAFIERRRGYFKDPFYRSLYEEIERVVAENPPRRMWKFAYERLAGPAKHPRPCDLPFFGKASARLQFVWQASHVKHVYNPDFLGKGIPLDKCETMGDHIAGGLTLIVLTFGDGCDPRRRLRIYELWMAAHLDEVILAEVAPRLPEWGRIKALVAEWREGRTAESRIVRQVKLLETALYAVTLGWHFPVFDPWPYFDRLEGKLAVPSFVELEQEARKILAETRPRPRVKKV